MGKIKNDYRDSWSNVSGTSNRSPSCNCGTWKNHWVKYSGSSTWPRHCSIDGCYNAAEVGGHMSRNGGNEYIVPICNSCNSKNTKMTIKMDTFIAVANQKETCNK